MSRKGKLSLIAAAAAVVIGSTAVATASTTTATHVSAPSPVAVSPSDHGVLSIAGVKAAVKAGRFSTNAAPGEGLTHPLKPSECVARYGSPCYGAAQLRHIYGADKLGPINGAGRKVALIGPGHNPVLKHDLEVYARQWELPAPHLKVIQQGHPAILDPAKPEQAVIAQELELDAEMILTMAPGATIIDVETEKDVAGSPAGFKGALDTIGWLATHEHVDAVSLSYGWFEANDDEATGGKGAALIRSQRAGLVTAARHHVTVLSANGDTGPTGPNLAGTALYPQETAAFIASDPLVTGVAGTELHADDNGVRTRPDTVWGEHDGDSRATGGALSKVFHRPSYQNGVRAIVGDHRGNADVAMDGSTASRVQMYTSRYQVLSGQKPGWVRAAGTSAASPLFAGIVADAAQVAGRPLGQINPTLYRLARTPATALAAGIADVTEGCNSVTSVPGHCALHGPDLASGVGTVGDASRFVRALALA